MCWMSCLAVLTHCCVIPCLAVLTHCCVISGLPLSATLLLVFPTVHVINSQKELIEFSLKILSWQVLRCPCLFFLSLCFLTLKVKARVRKKISARMWWFYFLAIFKFCVRKTFPIKLHLMIKAEKQRMVQKNIKTSWSIISIF